MARNLQKCGAPLSRSGRRRCRVKRGASGAWICVVGASEILQIPSRGEGPLGPPGGLGPPPPGLDFGAPANFDQRAE
eukprot:15432384-Alexandrium_andersonii.AAC.1